jgi:hypothetical protein
MKLGVIMSGSKINYSAITRLLPTLLPTSKTSLITIIACLMLVSSIGSQLWSYGRQYIGIDFYQFWVVPTANAKGEDTRTFAELPIRKQMGEQYYQNALATDDWRFQSVAEARRELETLSTPALYTVFSLFSSNNYEYDYCFFQIFSICVFLFSLLAFCLFLGFSWTEGTVFVALVSIYYEPLLSDIRVTNVNRLNVGFLCLCCFLAHYRNPAILKRITGLLLGAFIPYKPVLIGSTFLYLVARAAQRKWRELLIDSAWVAAGGALSLIAAMAYFSDVSIWFMWSREFSSMGDVMISLNNGNHSPAQGLSEWLGISRSIIGMLLGGIVLSSISGAWFLKAKQVMPELHSSQRSYQIDITAILLGVLLFFSASKLVWLHYQLMLTPLQAYLLRPQAVPGDSSSGGLSRDGSYWVTTIKLLSLASIVVLGFNGWQVWLGDGTVFAHRRAVAWGLGIVFAASMLELLMPQKRHTRGLDFVI